MVLFKHEEKKIFLKMESFVKRCVSIFLSFCLCDFVINPTPKMVVFREIKKKKNNCVQNKLPTPLNPPIKVQLCFILFFLSSIISIFFSVFVLFVVSVIGLVPNSTAFKKKNPLKSVFLSYSGL